MIIRSAVMPGLQDRTLMKSDGHASESWEDTGKIFVAIKEYDVWGIRTNQELMDVNRERDMSGKKKRRVRWLGNVERMPEKKRTAKKVFNNIPEGKRSFGKKRKRWLELLKMI
jgi:hypothetical protein